jgi:hypothetical protein
VPWRSRSLNDNNYPFSAGRVAGSPDPNEFIVIRLYKPLPPLGCQEDRNDDRHDHRDTGDFGHE